MTPEERQLLSSLADRIKSAAAQDRDPEADQALRQLTQDRPDAVYLLAQTVLMQDFALRNAQAQIAELQRQLQAARQSAPAPAKSGGFLSGLFGGQASAPVAGSVPPVNPWGNAPTQQAPSYAPPPPNYGAAPAYQPVMMQPTQTSGFLRSAATTAAGIAGGALLFEGIESLFAGHSGYGGFGGPMGGAWGGGMGGMGGTGWGTDMGPRESISETTINNNYYENAPTGGQGETPLAANYQPDNPGYQPDPSLTNPQVDLADYDPAGSQQVADSSNDYSSDDYGGGGGGDDYV
jgi:hypothetical protein